MNMKQHAELFFRLLLQHPPQSEWEIVILKLTFDPSDIEDVPEAMNDPEELVDRFAEVVGVAKYKDVTFQQALKDCHQKIKERGWLTVEEYMTGGPKYMLSALRDGIAIYGAAKMDKLSERLKRDAEHAGPPW